ncbi:hypothetical protein C806_02355 [Lachnospiraceae bacterium 3-1]|nr:hypothetical protein C806_02355 [Lachnospiraceae bacterium 3-1]
MIWKKKKKEVAEVIVDIDEELDNDEFFMAEEIDGYASCAGMNAQRCSTECFRRVMMPTVTVLS